MGGLGNRLLHQSSHMRRYVVCNMKTNPDCAISSSDVQSGFEWPSELC